MNATKNELQHNTMLHYYIGTTVNGAKGNWTVVAADGKIDQDGLGKSKGGKTVVASRSALILAR